jgi:hypothetical protein
MLILSLLMTTGFVRGQISGIDTLFKASELVYFSDLENKAFHDFLSGKPDYLAMIAAINPNTNERELDLYRDWVNEIIANIRAKKYEGQGREKQIDRIRKYVSKALLINFRHDADFDDLFRFGDFNSFTAASIYAFILDQLGIPYEIYELSTHVYLVAFPGQERIRIETTKPGYQYFMFDHQTRKNFVDYIHRRGIINDMTYRNTSIRELFQKYYFAGYGLSIREMIGMMYLNSAVEMILLERERDGYAQLEKGFILYPSYKSQYLLLLQLNRFLVDMDYRDPLSLGYLIKAGRLINYGIDRELIMDYLEDIVSKVLVKDDDPEGFGYIYDYLMEYLRDEQLKNHFTFLYLYESGRREFNDARYGKALDFLEPAYGMHPEDERVEDLLARSLAGYSLMVSPNIILQKIMSYDTRFTDLATEGIYLMVKVQTYLSLFGEAFQLKDGETGEKYMAEFEGLLAKYPETEFDHLLVGRSYSSAAIYYYRLGKIKESREVIERGLGYAPGNIELKLKLNAFE